jgi:hypothetical protein
LKTNENLGLIIDKELEVGLIFENEGDKGRLNLIPLFLFIEIEKHFEHIFL